MGKIYPDELKNKAVKLYRLDDKTTYAEVVGAADGVVEHVRDQLSH